MSLLSCAGKRPSNLGITDAQLTSCPSSNNCVSSDAEASDKTHYIAAFELNVKQTDAWQTAKTLVSTLPRTQIIHQTTDYLHAECSSAIFGFVDDLELHYRASNQTIAVRSASRLGSSDFGVNRKRVEDLRQQLNQQSLTKK